uniref:Uncharacterized protein n=1 Tax=Aegilops tauschii subsp. strangulata TaxID=200361 RepID=A0A453M5V6_AEGTS
MKFELYNTSNDIRCLLSSTCGYCDCVVLNLFYLLLPQFCTLINFQIYHVGFLYAAQLGHPVQPRLHLDHRRATASLTLDQTTTIPMPMRLTLPPPMHP